MNLIVLCQFRGIIVFFFYLLYWNKFSQQPFYSVIFASTRLLFRYCFFSFCFISHVWSLLLSSVITLDASARNVFRLAHEKCRHNIVMVWPFTDSLCQLFFPRIRPGFRLLLENTRRDAARCTIVTGPVNEHRHGRGNFHVYRHTEMYARV